MANYYGTGRSNYVEVTDKEKFENLCEERGLEVYEENGKVCCVSDNEAGDTNDTIYDDESGDEIYLPSFLDEVAKLLKPDEVFIWQHVGNEKARYLCGYSIAINAEGKCVSVNINDIYKKAKKLGKNITAAEY